MSIIEKPVRNRGSRITQVLRALEREPAGSSDEGCLEFKLGKETYEIGVANDLGSRERAYRLLHEVYSAQGYGQPHDSKLWFCMHNLLPRTVVLTVVRKGALVAAVTLVPDSDIGLPVDDAYGAEMDRLRAAGHRVTEVMSLGVKADERGIGTITARLVNFVCLTARYVQGATHLAITVVPHHASFYCNQMLFEQVGNEGFHRKTGVKCVLLCLDLDLYAKAVRRPECARGVSRYYVPEDQELNAVARLAGLARPITREEVGCFLGKRPELFAEASPRQQACFARLFGLNDGGACVSRTESLTEQQWEGFANAHLQC